MRVIRPKQVTQGRARFTGTKTPQQRRPSKRHLEYVRFAVWNPDTIVKMPRIFSKSGEDNKYRRRTQLERASGPGWTREDWLAFSNRYEGKCLRCGTDKGIVADHVVPMFHGGFHGLSNVQPLCWACNRWKGMRHFDYRTGGRPA